MPGKSLIMRKIAQLPQYENSPKFNSLQHIPDRHFRYAYIRWQILHLFIYYLISRWVQFFSNKICLLSFLFLGC